MAALNPKICLKVIALSQDQTPYRKDERERCKLEGARIMTMDQLEGLAPMHKLGCQSRREIDYLGLHHASGRRWAAPGTAHAVHRDNIAEDFVFATPEITT